jgi:hypothetical protein
MDSSSAIPIGTCTHGPVLLSDSPTEEINKFAISIIDYDGSRHPSLVSCKTTSQHHDKLWPGEFFIDDLFGYGRTKVQPHNIVRIQRQTQLPRHRHVGDVAPTNLPDFEMGLKLAIRAGRLDAKESLELADSWQRLFVV